MIEQCCYIHWNKVQCQAHADFMIKDEGDTNYETQYCYTCAKHVGNLLGHHEAISEPVEDRWTVTPV